METFGIQTDEQDKIFITQYTNIIKKNFSNPNFGIDDICKGIGISRAQFYRKAKAQTGRSPAEMIKKLRLEAAAQMIKRHGVEHRGNPDKSSIQQQRILCILFPADVWSFS